MIYDLFTYLIIIVAIVAFIRNIQLFFKDQSKCTGCSGKCEVKNLPKRESYKISNLL